MSAYKPIRNATKEEISAISLNEQGSALIRQINILETLLPRLVAQGKTTMWRAEHDLACMKAAYATVRGLEAEEVRRRQCEIMDSTRPGYRQI